MLIEPLEQIFLSSLEFSDHIYRYCGGDYSKHRKTVFRAAPTRKSIRTTFFFPFPPRTHKRESLYIYLFPKGENKKQQRSYFCSHWPPSTLPAVETIYYASRALIRCRSNPAGIHTPSMPSPLYTFSYVPFSLSKARRCCFSSLFSRIYVG